MALPPPSRLDANQVLQGSFDEATGRLRTDSLATVVNADIDVNIDAYDDSIAIADPVTGVSVQVNSDRSINTIQLNSLLNFKFDSIYPSYPSTTVEVYTYKNSGNIVGVITVSYTDITKNEIISVVRL